jgi:hypothetical protein
MSSITGSPDAGSSPGAAVPPAGGHESEHGGPDLPPGHRHRPHPHHSLLHDIESVVPFLIALAVLITIVVGLVVTVRSHPNTNGTEYQNTYGVFSNGS